MSVKGIVLRIAYSISVCFSGALLIAFTAIILFSLSNESEKYNQMLDNWTNSPIETIYSIPDNQNCLVGETSVFSYDWLGTKEGCFCKQTMKVSDKPCCSSKNSDSDDCCSGTPINSIDGFSIDKWAIPDPTSNYPASNIFKLCAKRLSQYNFRNNAPRTLGCKDNEQWCGFDQQGNKDADNGFCVDKKFNCPINEIIFSKDPITSGNFEQVNLPGDSLIKLYISRTSKGKLPLSEFIVRPTNTVCADRNKQVYYSKDYPLDKRVSSCVEYDYLFRNTNTQLNDKNLFSINKISQLVENLPNFKYSLEKYYLFSKNYISLKMSCRDDIKDFFSYADQIEKVERISTIIFTLCLVYAFELIFFETWISYCYPKYSWGVVIFRKKVNFLLKLIYILKFCLFIACNIVLIMQLYYYYKQQNFLDRNINGSCLDSDTQERFSNLKKNMQQDLVVATFIVLWILFLIEPNVGYLYGKCFGCSCSNTDKQQQIPDNKQNINNNKNVQLQPVYILNPNINAYPNQVYPPQYNQEQNGQIIYPIQQNVQYPVR